MKFNSAFYLHAVAMRDGALREQDWGFWNAAAQETEYLRCCWICITLYPGEIEGEDFWHMWLGHLQDRIGKTAYFSGQMVPAVPVWRFHQK